MIRVFADDLTGAAELAGMCKQHGLKTILTLVPEAPDHAEAIVYCTDSRSMDLASALTVTQQFLEPIALAKNGMVYKKTDSVLRGHVMEELLLQMHQMGYQRVLFIPQNPSMGRIINDGQYFVNGKLLSETSFADDPEFPRKTADVVDMLSAQDAEVHVMHYDDILPATGIIVGEASCREDLEQWVSRIDQRMMLAGGGDFFQAILEQRYGTLLPAVLSSPEQPFLYIRGSSFQTSVACIQALAIESDMVHYIDGSILEGIGIENWLSHCAKAINENKRAVIAFDPSLQHQDSYSALFLRQKMASIIYALLSSTPVGEILIEGGSTAKAILDEMNLPFWIPDAVIGRGVVRLQDSHQNYTITVKPGSYPLPDYIAHIFSINNH
jgi:uncharacterized protein YgbK (DUF1537 family)